MIHARNFMLEPYGNLDLETHRKGGPADGTISRSLTNSGSCAGRHKHRGSAAEARRSRPSEITTPLGVKAGSALKRPFRERLYSWIQVDTGELIMTTRMSRISVRSGVLPKTEYASKSF